MGVLSDAEIRRALGLPAQTVDCVSVEPLKSRRLTAPAEVVRARTGVARQRGAVQLPHPDYLDGPQYWFWDIAGECQSPRHIEEIGEGHATMELYRAGAIHPSDGGPNRSRWEPARTLWRRVRCRLCPPCLVARSEHWSELALDEARTASRTWFGTLTFGPAERYKALLVARSFYEDCTPSWDDLTGPERFRAFHRVLGPQVTTFVKRLRNGEKPIRDARTGKKPKRTMLRFRFLLTVEPHIWSQQKHDKGPMPLEHVDWFPHYHVLIHEVSSLMPIKKAHLENCWISGFTKWRLVKSEAAVRYTVKYLSKYSIARVRASKFYGLKNNTTISHHRF